MALRRMLLLRQSKRRIENMKFFIMFLEVPDFSAIKDDLIRFKQNLQRGASVTVIDIEQTNYDFLYNSLIEKANDEKRRGIKDA
jgi:hypothetical protein